MGNKKTHSRECEIMAFGICTCEFWETANIKEEFGIQEIHERMAAIVAICNEHSDGFDMLSHIKKIALGKEQYVPPSQR